MRKIDRDLIAAMRAIAAVVIVVVAGAGITAYVIFSDYHASDSPYDLQVGDFVKYNMDYVEDLSLPHSNITLKMEVMEITFAGLVMNYTYNLEGYEYSQIAEVPANRTLLLDYDLNNAPQGYSVSSIGRESMTVQWGTLPTDHVRVESQYQESTLAHDLWLKRGIPIKVQVHYINILQSTWLLIDTNLGFITSP